MRSGKDDETIAAGAAVLTRRLLLRSPSEADRIAIAILRANPRIADNLAVAPGSAGRACDFFAVVEREGGAVVGSTGFGPMPARPACLEVATLIGEPHWGRGFATEATQAIIDRAFRDETVLIVWCASRASNHRARRVVEKCGFQFRETGMVRSPAGRAVPVERFVLERRNWASLKEWGARGRRQDPENASHETAA